MRSRTPLFAFLLVAGSLAVPLVTYAGIPFFGPIVPDAINRCAAGWGAVIDVINRIIEFLLTLVIVFVAPLMIAYSGFLFVVNPVNAGGIAKAKSILLNTIIGIVIAFAGWLIVDAIMAVLYHPTDPILAGKAWSQLITSGGQPFCLIQEDALQNLNQSASSPGVTGVSANGGVSYVNGGATAQCSSSNTACSPAVLQAAGYSSAQANAMSCIAVTESSGNPYTKPSSTGACGTFQILASNWNNPKIHSGNCSSATSCNDPACNAQAAYLLSQQRLAKGQSAYADWTCPNCDAKAQSCVTQYDPGR